MNLTKTEELFHRIAKRQETCQTHKGQAVRYTEVILNDSDLALVLRGLRSMIDVSRWEGVPVKRGRLH